ncbi:MAG: BrnT family toxin [Mesorhizobium sp.]|nr:BrnT family toxin [Mesorhizobium sp.]MCO5160337.1 BrnT family toxin [Mesorhizobium sp.]
MRIVWDEPKRLQNLAKHGMDFAELTPSFFDNARVAPAREGRFLAIGDLGGKTVAAVVFRVLGAEGVSVISMRPASRKERNM